ncbi:MAG: glutathione peroxidase [Xanthomonadales bacterium]|nr:glutathione peroxidase [Xanthomonadales bacterium]
MSKTLDFSATAMDGTEQPLAQWQGKTLLIVNVASKCGFTPQYAGLQSLHDTFRERGLVVLGFPCNQFAHQEPGSDAEIAAFCSATYAVDFPMFAKIDVNGAHTHPLYRYLKHAAPGVLGSEAIKWNFTKFLVDASGSVIKRYAPSDTPEKIAVDLEAML